MRVVPVFLTVCLTVSVCFAQLPKKNIVIEDHTGAWCGWCVLGNQALEDLHAEYGNRIIPIAWHNGDSMTLAMQKTMATKFKITGYPTGMINRNEYSVDGTTSNGIHPNNWADVVGSLKDEQSVVDVSVTYSIDKQTRILSGTVTATMYVNYNNQLAFNVAIMEDSVTGEGKGWDQTNYLTNRKEYISHPYYYLPGTITNYYHMNVLREFIGGENGDVGQFAATAQKGTVVTYPFTIDLKQYPIQHDENVWVAGLVVQNGEKNLVMNAALSGKKPTPKSTYWKAEIASEKDYVTSNRNTTVDYILTVNNPNNKPVTALLDVNTDESNIANGWAYNFSRTQIQLDSNTSDTVRLTVTVGKDAGFTGLSIRSQIKPFDEYRSLPSYTNVGVLSDGVKWAIAKFDLATMENMEPLMQSYKKIDGYNKDWALIDINKRTLQTYDFSQFDLFFLPESYSSRTTVVFNQDLCTAIKKSVDAGKSILMTSPMNLWLVGDNYGSMVSGSIKQLFKETFGITGAKRTWGPWLWNSSEGKSAVIPVRSFQANGVADNMDFNLNETDATYTVQTHWLDEISILDDTRTHRILNFYGDKFNSDTAIAATWTQLPRSTMIYQGFGFESIKDEPIRRTLLANYLMFLQKTVDVPLEDINSAHITITPNPVVQTVRIQYSPRGGNNPVTVSLLDALGNTVQTLYQAIPTSQQQTLQTDVTTLANGKYFIMVIDNGVYSVQPIVIAR
ncbi:MAG: Omp28-related outer membrane protein [Candidatus Kapabacteria bacterium]|nr:Omp28-related outer membrane protein [Candidatus Kapabacteria bacterium]